MKAEFLGLPSGISASTRCRPAAPTLAGRASCSPFARIERGFRRVCGWVNDRLYRPTPWFGGHQRQSAMSNLTLPFSGAIPRFPTRLASAEGTVPLFRTERENGGAASASLHLRSALHPSMPAALLGRCCRKVTFLFEPKCTEKRLAGQ